MDDEHGDARAVFRVIPLLLNFIGGGVDGWRVDFGPERWRQWAIEFSFFPIDQRAYMADRQIHVVDRRCDRERLESIEKFVAIPFAVSTEDSADGGQRDVTQLL